MRSTVILALLAATACGKEDAKSGDEGGSEQHSMLVADAAALPACDAESEGWIVYVQADKKLQACSAGAWADAPLASAETGSAIETRWLCGRGDDLDPDDSTTIQVDTVQFVKFKSGDSFISCTALMTFPDTLDMVTASQALFYNATDKAVTDGVFSCPNQFVTTEFTLATGKAKYKSTSNDSHDQDKACEEAP